MLTWSLYIVLCCWTFKAVINFIIIKKYNGYLDIKYAVFDHVNWLIIYPMPFVLLDSILG